MYRQTLFLILFLLTPPSAALAQSVDIVSAVERAVTKRPTIVASQAQQQAAASAVREARSRYLPQLNFSETFSMTNEPAGSLFIALNQERDVMSSPGYNFVDPDTQQDFETRLTLAQTLFDADTGYRLKEANKRLEAAQARSDWSRESAGFAAFQAYLGVQRALADRAAVDSSEQEASELLRLADERYAAGIGLKADQLRARVFHAEASRRALTARNNVILTQRRLALAIGQAEGEIAISAPLDAAFFASFPSALPATERADLQAFSLDVESLALATKRSRAAYLPRLDLSASYGLHHESRPFGADGEAWRLGATLNWELFDGFRRDASVARADAEKAAAAAELSEARREQTFRRAEVELRIAEARARKESAEQGLVAALEGQRLLQQRYESGLTDLVDLLATQSALDQARSFVVAADIQLLFLSGQALLEEGRFVATILAKDEVSP
ncbi:MAG: TolC family protein [Desulfuromonadales bacterium]|nr:TolC family protein [Desulfuromonadales bacterium]